MKEVVWYNHALQLINNYSPSQPLNLYLKQYFKNNSQIGSKDRKILRNLVYQYFRLGNLIHHTTPETGLVLGHFLSEDQSNNFLEYWLPQKTNLNPADTSSPIEVKLNLASHCFPFISLENHFPLCRQISTSINRPDYIKSLFNQPYTYIRIKQGYVDEIEEELKHYQLEPIQQLNDHTMAFTQSLSLTQLPAYQNGKFEIQDKTSQKTLSYIEPQHDELWWDCCAGSGGKSLLFKEQFPETHLWVSDSRKRILDNLQSRFERNKTPLEKSFQLDLTQPIQVDLPQFSGIILDAPCTGSGTWARTPENIPFATEQQLHRYQKKQRQMLVNVIPYLKKHGQLLYITCSVFKHENEENIDYIHNKFDMQIQHEQYLKGYSEQAENFFVATLVKA